MGAGTFGVAGLVGSFAHNPIPLLQTICLIEGMGVTVSPMARRFFFLVPDLRAGGENAGKRAS